MTFKISGSCRPPLTSLIQFAPAFNEEMATEWWKVSTEIGKSGCNDFNSLITGTSRLISISDPTSGAPGLVLWAPKSRT